MDVGVRSLAVLSTGEIIPNPKHLEVALRELRWLQRQAARRTGPDNRTNTRPSNRWRQTQARIAKLHARVASVRRDGLHKLSTRLVRMFGTIVVEDLHVAGMLANRRLARRVAGVGMAELRRQIEYKAVWTGVVRVHVADRWFPSSKMCSACGVVKAKLRLSERTYECDQCDLVRRVLPREDPRHLARANADTATRRLRTPLYMFPERLSPPRRDEADASSRIAAKPIPHYGAARTRFGW